MKILGYALIFLGILLLMLRFYLFKQNPTSDFTQASWVQYAGALSAAAGTFILLKRMK